MVPAALRDRQQWLVWKFETLPGDKKPRKVPYYADGAGRRHGEQGTEEDRRHLVTFDAALRAKGRATFDGVGFAFLPGDGLAGIDLDQVIDLSTGEISERATNIIKALDSYTEKSPSGAGVHIFVTTELTGAFKSFKKNAIGVEVLYYGHGDGTWPDTQRVMQKMLSGLPAPTIRKLTHQNAAKLYRHPLPTVCRP